MSGIFVPPLHNSTSDLFHEATISLVTTRQCKIHSEFWLVNSTETSESTNTNVFQIVVTRLVALWNRPQEARIKNYFGKSIFWIRYGTYFNLNCKNRLQNIRQLLKLVFYIWVLGAFTILEVLCWKINKLINKMLYNIFSRNI